MIHEPRIFYHYRAYTQLFENISILLINNKTNNKKLFPVILFDVYSNISLSKILANDN